MNRFIIKFSFIIFILIIFSCASNLSAGGELTSKHLKGYFPIEIINQTHIAQDEEVYITVKGTDLKTGDSCFLQFNEKGVGTCHAVYPEVNTLDFAYKLSDLKKVSDSPTFYLPHLASGRVYISIGEPVRFQIATQGGKSLIIDPDGFKPRDPNYYTLYDKIEFSFVPPSSNGLGGGTWMNPTAVDFFSLPLSIKQAGSTGFSQTGISHPRNELLDTIKGFFISQDRTPTQEWNKLFLSFTNQDNEEVILRLMSPGKAMIQGVPGTNPLDPYLLNSVERFGFNFTDYLWNYYRTHTLAIDTSELRDIGNQPISPLFIGQVEGNDFVFTNLSDPQNRVVLPKPSRSVPWFAGALDSFNAANNTPKAIIVRQLTSAFEVGLLPAPDKTVLDRNYFDEQRTNNKYYTENPLLGGTKTGPWFDLYSQALHQWGEDQPIYSFAYDDALGQDGTLHDPHPLDVSTAVITLGDMSDTVIPRPFKDMNHYSVQVLIGFGSTVTYQGKPLKQNETLYNVTVPMQVKVNGQPVEMYFNPAIVLSKSEQAEGIVIECREKDAVRVIFPGR